MEWSEQQCEDRWLSGVDLQGRAVGRRNLMGMSNMGLFSSRKE
jgi:hypothetical protein